MNTAPDIGRYARRPGTPRRDWKPGQRDILRAEELETKVFLQTAKRYDRYVPPKALKLPETYR